MKTRRGFTLIELMIVVLVIAVLAGLALSAYTKQVRKSRRAEAKQALSELMLREEKWRSNNIAYGTCDEALAPSTCVSLNSGLNYYTVALVAASNTATAYQFTATPKADQTKDSCGTLSVSMNAGAIGKTPTTVGCW